MTYMPFKDSNTKVSRVYKINQTSDKYEEDSNIDAEKFEKIINQFMKKIIINQLYGGIVDEHIFYK